MQLVPLTAGPNQALSFNQDGAFWQLRIYQAIDSICADVSRDGNVLINGVRCFVGQGILPYGYMYPPNFGNFVFDAVPDWNNFGGSCNLYYLNAAEFAAFQAGMLT